jgi:hypothetical protein
MRSMRLISLGPICDENKMSTIGAIACLQDTSRAMGTARGDAEVAPQHFVGTGYCCRATVTASR